MSDGRILIYSAIGFFVGLFLFYKGFEWWREKKLIQNTPTSKVRALAMGRVELKGAAIPQEGKLFTSPFTKKKCVWCKWSVEEYRSSGKSGRWVTIRSKTLSEYFYLRDKTGTVLVNPRGAKIDIKQDTLIQGGRISSKVEGFLKDMKIKSRGLLGFRRQLRIRESFIEPEDQLYIMGYAGDNPFVDDATAQKNEIDIMVQKGKAKFYYITDSSEKDLLSKFGWKIFGGLYGGGALSLVCLAIIFAFFGAL